MNKKEIEKKIIEECKLALPNLSKLPFDKGLPLLQAFAWEIADKYDIDGSNIINIILSNWKEINE